MDEIRIKFKACLLLVVLIQISSAAAQQAPTDPNDAAALNSFKSMWKNRPSNWENSDPCVGGWVGVTCNNSQVISIKLSSMGLEGQLSGDIGALTELQTLDLSYNRGLNGPLPAEAIGSLKKLSNLILVGCSFSGRIPSTIGDLEELVFFRALFAGVMEAEKTRGASLFDGMRGKKRAAKRVCANPSQVAEPEAPRMEPRGEPVVAPPVQEAARVPYADTAYTQVVPSGSGSQDGARSVLTLRYALQKSKKAICPEEVTAWADLPPQHIGKSGIKLDWTRGLRVAVGSARGVAYLHEHVNPPIIHRDIKSTNILLDNHLNAKVSDFGLSKLMDDDEKGHVSTQVKGTMGYLDPEYYMTQQLTEKSDAYSFGVIMLELITARKPIEHGKYIVREVKAIMDKTKDLYGLHELLDPVLGLISTSLKGFEEFVDLAMRCLQESTADRPLMSEVVKEIEGIMKFSGLNTTDDFASTSESYGETSREHSGNPYSNETIEYSSGNIHHHKVESQ
ncbi:PREDICTED: probable leucine-rich repeat receptor-like protein kinase At5g49770 [Nelumbo nucifera]|uniref:non-specific serine/threonine protein kinase n=1 Tax=Nelumbo nucifera TaxID=4432 RepID=A0A1U8Q1I3_NELNU|nr:PREDICTED: probable leucine-rich repeat receptor-like protein kinase At5g49770 [Nelumbo nucifera]